MSVDENQPAKPELLNRVESYLRRFFERVGGALDFALRRPLNPQARTDLSALLPQLEQAIEAKLRREGQRLLAPNLIELRYDYETYSQLTQARIEYLQRELAASLYEYVVNHRYATLGQMQIKLAFDVFTRKLTITASFPDEAAAVTPGQAALPAASKPAVAGQRWQITLRAVDRQLFGDLRAALTGANARAGVGRSQDNALCLNDASVSSFHAAFTLGANNTLLLADLGSSNGTFVNGVRLGVGDKTSVREGDMLRFGDVELKLSAQFSA